MKFAILIPTRNRPDDLLRCLKAIIPQTARHSGGEIIVCDDSDRDETAQLLNAQHPAVRRVAGPRRGPGANRNCGAAATTADWLIFLDDDVIPRARWLDAFLEAANAAGTAPAVLAGSTWRIDAHARSLLWEAPSHTGHGPVPPSCNFALRRTLFTTSGGFDERFTISYEDIEFFSRLNAAGAAIHFVAEAAVDHPSRPLPSPARLARRWEARVIMAYDYGASSAQILWHLPRHVLMVMLSKFREDHDPAGAASAALHMAQTYVAFLARLPGWIARHRCTPRSPFWTSPAGQAHIPHRFGF